MTLAATSWRPAVAAIVTGFALGVSLRPAMSGRCALTVMFLAVSACGQVEEPKNAPQPTSAAKVYQIGWLGHGATVPEADRRLSDFQLALRDLGYVEGKNVVIDYRYSDGDADRLPKLAAELVRLKADVIVTSGELAALAAKRATNAIPVIVTESGMDPVKSGLVASLSQPGANVTGLATQDEEAWQKRLSVLKQQVAPKVSRLSVLWNPTNPGNASCIDAIMATALALGLQVGLHEVRDAGGLERALAAVATERPDALLVCWDNVTLTHAGPIAEFAVRQRLPLLAPIREYAAAGSLMSYGINVSAHRRRAAYYVDKVLKGVKPDKLPVEQPPGFDLVFNLVTAKTLGIVIPQQTLMQADELIR